MKRRDKLIWLGGGTIALIAVALAIIFAMTHTNGHSGPNVAASNAQPRSNVLISDNCATQNDEGLYEPTTIQLTCGDGTEVANGLIWSQWGSATATGHGKVNEVSCIPNCAEGKDVDYPVDVALTRPVKAKDSKEYFVRITLTFTAEHPGDSATQIFKACADVPDNPFTPACPPGDQGAS